MNEILQKLNKKIIVSCQASSSEPLYKEECMNAMIKSVITGGASGLRLAGERDIRNAKNFCTQNSKKLPIIGITKPDPLPKNWKDVVYITPNVIDVRLLAKAGADIIAFDGTSRVRNGENLAQIICAVKELGLPAMADISTLEEGIMCRLLGADIISTTLSGYTTHTQTNKSQEPDFELLKNLVKILDCPVILEGRIWMPEHVKHAFELGAFSVVIGSAITRPQLITQKFVQAVK